MVVDSDELARVEDVQRRVEKKTRKATAKLVNQLVALAVVSLASTLLARRRRKLPRGAD